MSAETRSVHVMISGRVQGVGYRAWCRRTAMGLGLSGWVRNRLAGEVEAVFCGNPASVEAMLAACEDGPGWARIDAVRVVSEVAPVEGGFEMLATR